jgi:hypothetical protein
MSRPRFSMFALVVLAIAVAGCGGSERLSKTEYQQKLKGAGVELANASKPLAQATTGAQFASGVEQVQDGMRKVADDLDGLNPPEEVDAANDRLVDALRGVADEFDKVKEAAAKGAADARAAGARLARSQASEDASQAILEIQRRGYDVGLLSSG